MTLSEELLLLAPEESDQPGETARLSSGLAAALLLDLAAEGLVVAKGKTIVGVVGDAADPLLNAALAELLGSDEPRTAQHWVTHLPSALDPLRTQVSTMLAERTLLVDPAPELRARLHRVLVYGGEPDPRTALLISLLRTLGLVRAVVDKHHRKQADARAKAISQTVADASTTPATASRAVHAAQASVLAAVISAVSAPAPA